MDKTSSVKTTEISSSCRIQKQHPVTLFSVINKIFEKIFINRLADQLVKCGLVSDFLNQLQTLAILFDRITRSFNKSRLLEL